MGFLPRFANPHFVQESTQIVSRADLEADHDVPHEEADEDDQDVVQALENILKRSLGDFQVGQAEPERQQKRRKKSEAEAREEEKEHTSQQGDSKEVEVVEFRLLSKAAKAVSLKPKPAPQIIAVEPAWEDDEQDAALRAERARAAAVDVSWILEESRKAPYLPNKVDKKLIVITPEQPIPTTEMMVFELPRSPAQSSTLLAAPLKAPPKERPSPHEFPPEKVCCPVIPVTVTHAESLPRQHKPRHKKASGQPRPPPSFWRPMREWGGKSLGYAMGYDGSRPIPTGSVRQWRYRRDTMKKGILVA